MGRNCAVIITTHTHAVSYIVQNEHICVMLMIVIECGVRGAGRVQSGRAAAAVFMSFIVEHNTHTRARTRPNETQCY